MSANNTVRCTLTADLAFPKVTGKGKLPTTIALVKFGPILVASKKLVGKWSVDQVLRDFKMNHKSYRVVAPEVAAVAVR